ncbi:MAG: hypothetical protein AAF705_06090 [Bacteroidota bacterium]
MTTIKNIGLILFVSCFYVLTTAAQSPYEAGMQKALEHLGKGEHQQATALLERISKAEQEKWIPNYYLAQALVYQSFAVENSTDKTALLEKAKLAIAGAHEKSPNNSEVMTLEGLLYTAYVVIDPANYAMKYEPKIIALHQKAIKLNPDNPRAHLNLIQYNMNKGKWFGEDMTPYCNKLKALIPKFENQTSEMPFAPSHGQAQAEEIINSCNE